MAYRKKYAKKYVPKASKKLVKNYPKTAVAKTQNIARDVAKLKKQLKQQRPEVKYIDAQLTPTGYSFGQVNVNSTGAVALFLPTAILNSGQQGGRVGDEIRNIGIQMRLQLRQMSNLHTACRVIMDVFKTDDILASASDYLPLLYDTDTISGVIDYNSTRVPSTLKVYNKIFSKNIYLAPDDYNGNVIFKDIKALIKRQDVLKYVGSTSVECNNIRYVVTFRASTGNANSSTASTLPLVINTNVSSGCIAYLTTKMYFTDN